MKLSLTSRSNLEKCIDADYGPETSIVSRYRNVFTFGEPEEDLAYKELLRKTSLREGARLFPLLTYHGVDIHLLDESSWMHTGTLKSIDGCVTIAKCRLKGYQRVVFESGGNTGTALTEYGQKAGLETFLFIPEENVSLLDSRVFEPEKAHLISVAKPGWVKPAAGMFKGLNGIKHIPEVSWRYEASMFRGLFILEHMIRGFEFDWMAQTISAAFGPIGIYSVLQHFLENRDRIPRFLGIQQEANCPMYKAWKSKSKELEQRTPQPSFDQPLLTRVMYDVAPYTYGTYGDLRDVLTACRGDLTTISHSEFFSFLEQDFDGRSLFDFLSGKGVDIQERDGEVIDKTGLISLAGTLKEIDKHTIPEGSRVLCCLTSGTGRADGKAKPEYRVSRLDEVVKECRRMIYGD